MRQSLKSLVLASAALLLAACNFAPKYKTPTVETAPQFKELTPEQTNQLANWHPAAPGDRTRRGDWWTIFGDTNLNALAAQLEITNQTVAAAVFRLEAARAIYQQTRSTLFPLIGLDPSASRSKTRLRTTLNGAPGSSEFSTYNLPLNASWEPDLWGRIRNAAKSDRLEAEAVAADLENVRLSAEAELALDYFNLRALDAQKALLDSAVKAYQESYDLARARYETGIASDQDVAQAQTQLTTTRAQATDLGIQRAQLEHAIAVLVGRAASGFSIAPQTNRATLPNIPAGVPSALLQRRPDIAAAERRAMEANANIGVARAAYFPNVTLSGSAGFQGTTLGDLASWPNFVWSVGGTISETIFDAGRRRGVTKQSWAEYNQSVANYRQAVLVSFKEVEDFLVALRLLRSEIADENEAVESSQRYLNLASDRYKLGIDSYLNVITAQTTLLANQRTAVNLEFAQITASINLVKALGGKWD